LSDITVFEDVYRRYAYLLMHSPFLSVGGHVERRGRGGVQLIARTVAPFPTYSAGSGEG